MTARTLAPTVPKVTSPDRHRLAASLLVVALGTACGGGGVADVGERSRTREPRATPAPRSSTIATTTTTRPSASKYDEQFDSVPAPKIVDRGLDYVAISRSLVAYGTWLQWHHPDPKLVENAFARGSPIARAATKQALQAIREHKRVIEVDAAPDDYVLLSTRENVVSFRVTEHLAHSELIDARGRVLEHAGPGIRNFVVSIMRFGIDAPWRINLTERLETPPEVQLTRTVVGAGALHGGSLAVGIEVGDRGTGGDTGDGGLSVPIDSYSPSLPRLVHYVSTPLPGGRAGDLGNLCNASGAASNDPALVAFGWLYDVVAYSLDGRVISDTHVCVAFPVPADPTAPRDTSTPPPAPVLPVAPTIGDVWRAVELPRPVVGANPVTRGVTGLDTQLWSGGAQTVQIAFFSAGFRITGTARVVEYRFFTDEGYLGATISPGDATNPAATHRFTTKGEHSVSVASVWRANVTMLAVGAGPGGGVPVPIEIDTAVLTATVVYPVVEVRSKLVA
jgi:hypothetical protein